jgi:DNA-directed RNA polymerase I and III subunit RPAC1
MKEDSEKDGAPSSSSKKSTQKKKKLPDRLEEQRKLVVLTNEAPLNTRNLYYSGAYKQLGIDNSFNLDEFKENFQINIISCDNEKLVFDMIGVDAPIANAFRRILIAEVPTMAIEKVYIMNNTSVCQDEVLAHRLGLIPIKADPRRFNYKNKSSDEFTPKDTIVFKLHVKCTKNPNSTSKDSTDQEKYINSSVYSRDLVWDPQEEQAEQFRDEPIRPVHDDILIMKLRPGQEIDLLAYCEKGVGKDHAKFSSVATATYRLLPSIQLLQEIRGDAARELVALCPMGVFDTDMEDIATVARPRNCTMCRECIRNPKFTNAIKLARVKDHFIFSVESTGILPPAVLFQEAVKVLREKCTDIESELDRHATGANGVE